MVWMDKVLTEARKVYPVVKIPSETQLTHTRIWQDIPFKQEMSEFCRYRFDMLRPNAIGPGPVVFVKYSFRSLDFENIEKILVKRLAVRLGVVAIGTYYAQETREFLEANADEMALDIQDIQNADELELEDLAKFTAEASKELGIDEDVQGNVFLVEPWFSKVFEKYAAGILSRYEARIPKRTIHLCGDSTMANKEDLFYPERGWGQAFYSIAPKDFAVINHAENGRSTKTFRTLGHLQTLAEKVRAGDIVVFQFGHNDAALNRPERYVTPAEYKDNLSDFVSKIQSMGAVPVLATPVARRHWVNGDFVPSHGEYPEAVKKLAESKNIRILDIEAHTNAMVISAGEEGSKELYLPDNSHFSRKGAYETAKIADNLLKELGIYEL